MLCVAVRVYVENMRSGEGRFLSLKFAREVELYVREVVLGHLQYVV